MENINEREHVGDLQCVCVSEDNIKMNL